MQILQKGEVNLVNGAGEVGRAIGGVVGALVGGIAAGAAITASGGTGLVAGAGFISAIGAVSRLGAVLGDAVEEAIK
jgi:hypothetical protein